MRRRVQFGCARPVGTASREVPGRLAVNGRGSMPIYFLGKPGLTTREHPRVMDRHRQAFG